MTSPIYSTDPAEERHYRNLDRIVELERQRSTILARGDGRDLASSDDAARIRQIDHRLAELRR